MINSITRAQIQVFGSNAQNTNVHESSTRVVIILLCEFAFFFFFLPSCSPRPIIALLICHRRFISLFGAYCLEVEQVNVFRS